MHHDVPDDDIVSVAQSNAIDWGTWGQKDGEQKPGVGAVSEIAVPTVAVETPSETERQSPPIEMHRKKRLLTPPSTHRPGSSDVHLREAPGPLLFTPSSAFFAEICNPEQTRKPAFVEELNTDHEDALDTTHQRVQREMPGFSSSSSSGTEDDGAATAAREHVLLDNRAFSSQSSSSSSQSSYVSMAEQQQRRRRKEEKDRSFMRSTGGKNGKHASNTRHSETEGGGNRYHSREHHSPRTATSSASSSLISFKKKKHENNNNEENNFSSEDNDERTNLMDYLLNRPGSTETLKDLLKESMKDLRVRVKLEGIKEAQKSYRKGILKGIHSIAGLLELTYGRLTGSTRLSGWALGLQRSGELQHPVDRLARRHITTVTHTVSTILGGEGGGMHPLLEILSVVGLSVLLHWMGCGGQPPATTATPSTNNFAPAAPGGNGGFDWNQLAQQNPAMFGDMLSTLTGQQQQQQSPKLGTTSTTPGGGGAAAATTRQTMRPPAPMFSFAGV